MSIFNKQRLTNDIFKLDIERMRKGWYSDKYFINAASTLAKLAAQNYQFQGETSHLDALELEPRHLKTGDVWVEMQLFTRRKPMAVIAGVDKALSMLRHCTGYFDETGRFVETWQRLEVEAVQDGMTTRYNGDVNRVQPIIKVRGRYRDFAILETPMLGALTRGSRIATNVYNTLLAACGKPVMFFPARFDAHEVQAIDGYAYDIGVNRFNLDSGGNVASFVSTDAQGDWWGGLGGGTVAHAAIASFLGDTVEVMLAFAATQAVNIPRVALVDFNNDSVGTSLAVLKAMFERYRSAMDVNNTAEAGKYRLFGVRLDTSSNMRDVSLAPLGDKKLDNGVNPRLVWTVRQALGKAWQDWNLPVEWQERAVEYCKEVKIVVSGGFNPAKIDLFEELNVPVDIYGVGSSLMSNDGYLGTNTDFTADVVRVRLQGEWVDMAKTGRSACDNPDLKLIDLTPL
ncbi:MAG: nicotinate phosphoribosyltransferase [Anaerolineaceae bacterium 4572_5.2]|nr:MAG: nicotinate phosphoribosyltransferase [Anaerolineaceae bacterium 4572_5.2]